MMQDRRSFLKLTGLASASLVVPTFAGEVAEKFGQLIVPKAKGLKITGTFLDEISHDIPHQNWGVKEWNADFEYMKAIGIDTVIMIRCGHRRFITWPSEYLLDQGCYMPSVDLVDMFLRLAERHGMGFYFGLYDPGRGFGEYAEMNKFVIDEAWRKYGCYPAFKGWYISSEFSRRQSGCIEAVHAMGRQCFGFFVPDWSIWSPGTFGVNVLVTPERSVHACLKAYREGNFYGAKRGLNELRFTRIAFNGTTVEAETDKPARLAVITGLGVVKEEKSAKAIKWEIEDVFSGSAPRRDAHVFARIKAYALDASGEELFSQPYMLV